MQVLGLVELHRKRKYGSKRLPSKQKIAERLEWLKVHDAIHEKNQGRLVKHFSCVQR